MNKALIVENLAAKANVSKKDAGNVLDAFTEVVAEALANKEEIQLVGFGKFYAKPYKARKMSNYLGSGETKIIPAGVTPKFKAGKTFKDTVKGQ